MLVREKKAVSGILLTLLLTSMLTLAFHIQTAKAEPGTIYIRADGSIDPPTAQIGQDAGMLFEAPPTEWNKTYGGASYDEAFSVAQTCDGGYALAGYTLSFGASQADFYLVKTDGNGDLQWNKTYGGSGDDYAYSVVQTNDDGYAIAGWTNSFGAGDWDFWLVKTDALGNIQWNKTYGAAYSDEAFSMVQTTDGGYAIAGNKDGWPYPGDFWLVKTDATGNTQWNKTYGFSGTELAYSMVQTSDGGYAMAGYTDSFGGAGGGAWLVKTDTNGNMQWNKNYGVGSGDLALSAVQTRDSGYAMAGCTTSPGNSYYYLWLAKTAPDGNMEWNKTYGGGTTHQMAFSVVQTNDEGYAIAGGTASDGGCGLLKTDSEGNAQWNNTFGEAPNYGDARSVVQTSDGGYVIAGATQSYGAGSADFWLVKIGKAEWGTIYIRADGSIDPPTTPISTVDNVTYILTGNITSNTDGIVVERSNIIIDGNGYTLQGSGSGTGIDLSGRENVTVHNTQINAFYYSIYLSASSNNSISGNSITNNYMGIAITASSSTNINGNNITANNSDGICLAYSCNNSIGGNNIAANYYYGILAILSTNNTSISGNNITGNNRDGILLQISTNYNSISGNNIRANNQNGIGVENCSSNSISENNISANNGYGIWLSFSSDNFICHNDFIDNIYQVFSHESANVWDNGYPSGGNYWSEYTGVDEFSGPNQDQLGSDGIWDHPYIIDADNQDRYPLVNPWTPTPPAPDFSISAFPTSLTIQQGSSDSSIITIASINGFDQLVTLTKAGMPSGVTALLSSQFVAPGPGGSETSTLTVTVDSTAAPGSYSIIVNGTSGSLIHETEIYLNIVIAEPLEISMTAVQDPDFGIYSARMHIYNKDSQSYTVAYGFLTANDEVLNVANYIRGTMNLQYVIADNPFEMLPSGNAFFDIVFDPRESADLGALTNAKLKIEYSTEWGNIVKYEPLHFEAFDYVAATNFNMTRDAYSFSNNEWGGDGKCYGMAATSVLYFSGKIALPEQRTTYSLSMEEAGPRIDAYQDSWLNKFSTGWIGLAGNKLNANRYNVLKDTIQRGEPMIFVMSKQEQQGKTIHAVAAYKILETKTMAYIIIYDNIWSYTYCPSDTTMSFRYMTYDFASKELRYEAYTDFKLVNAEMDWWQLIKLNSAGELRICDSENRVTGLVNGEVRQEIPLSSYDEENETITIYYPDDIYRYVVVGTYEGTYGLEITSIEDENTADFSAIDIQTAPNAAHQYIIDWIALSLGEEGVTVMVDSDGNGVAEYNFTSDDELTRTEYVFATTKHDIEITGMTTAKSVIGQGYNMLINLTIMNYGPYVETFDVTSFANATPVMSQTIVLESGNFTTLTFSWNTTGFAKGNYTLWSYAEPVQGETFTSDNNSTGGWIIVAMIGDITGAGGYPDGKIDVRDVAGICSRYGAKPPDPKYDVNWDITGPTPGLADGRIDVRDVALVASRYGQKDP